MQRRTFFSALALPALTLSACGGGDHGSDTTSPLRATPVGKLAVSSHASVSVADGGVLIVGGDRGQATLSDAVVRFDPATRRLSQIAALASGRASHTALALADGRVLVAGGTTALEVMPFAELIDPVSGAVADGGRLAWPRQMHAMTLLADGRVLVSGGSGRDSAEVWDPATNRWRLLASRMSHSRAGHSATLLSDGRVLLAGGDAQGHARYVFAELWDPRTEAFTPLDTAISEQRLMHAAWRTRDGSVYIVGGEVNGVDAIVPLDSAMRFDVATLRFGAATGLSVARTLAVPVVSADDSVLLIGGQTIAERATGRLTRWTAAGGEQPLATLPGARLWHTASRLPDGRVLVVGGEDGTGRFVADMLMLE